MGRFVTCGILTEITINQKNLQWNPDYFNMKNETENILKDIGRIINTDAYNITKMDNGNLVLNLKTDFIDKHFCNLIKEIREVTKSDYYINKLYDYQYRDDYKNEDEIDPENMKISTSIVNDEYIIQYDNYKLYSERFYFPFYWILSDKRLFDSVTVKGSIVPIWIDENKIVCEDESFLLKIMNIMKTKCFKSELYKCLVFEIFG